MEFDAKTFLQKRVSKDITTLFVGFINLIEDLRDEGIITEQEYQKFRKRILDSGNSCKRSLEDQINNFSISLGKEQNEKRY